MKHKICSALDAGAKNIVLTTSELLQFTPFYNSHDSNAGSYEEFISVVIDGYQLNESTYSTFGDRTPNTDIEEKQVGAQCPEILRKDKIIIKYKLGDNCQTSANVVEGELNVIIEDDIDSGKLRRRVRDALNKTTSVEKLVVIANLLDVQVG